VGSISRSLKALADELGMTPYKEKIFCDGLHSVLDRLIMSNKLVMELAKMEFGRCPPDDLIIKARRYVLSHMTYEVGVRKMAKERWNMVLLPKEKKPRS